MPMTGEVVLPWDEDPTGTWLQGFSVIAGLEVRDPPMGLKESLQEAVGELPARLGSKSRRICVGSMCCWPMPEASISEE